MSLRKKRARRRRSSKRNSTSQQKPRNSFSGLRAIEPLEARAMMTATPTGAELDLGDVAGREIVSLQSADVGVSATGETVVAFEGTEGTARVSSRLEQEIYVQRFGDDGLATGDLVVVNSVTNGIQAESSVAVASDGSFLVVWSGRGNGDRTGIFGQRFGADGDPDGEQFRINTERRGTQSQPAVAIAGDGSAVVVWHGPGVEDASGIWMQRISADGELVGDETLVNTTTEGEQVDPSVAMNDEGNFVVAWSSRGQDGDAWGIFAQRFDANGNTVGDEFAGNTTTVGSQRQPSVAISTGGQFTIAWDSLGQDGDSWGVFARRFDENGSAIGGEFGINEETVGHQRNVDIAMADAGEIFVAWNDGQQDGLGWEVAGRTYDRDGQASGDVVSVNDAADSVGEVGHQQAPAVAVSASGRGFVTFDDSSAGFQTQVGAQRYDVEVGPIENVAPVIVEVSDLTAGVGETVEIALSATDANFQDELTFTIADDSPVGAIIVAGDTNGTATFEFTPTLEDRLTRRTFRVIVADAEGLSSVTQFNIDITNGSPVIDLNGSGSGLDSTVDFLETDTRIDLITSDLVLSDPDQTELSGVTIQLRNPLNVATENLLIDNSVAPGITAVYDNGRKLWTLSGEDTIANYSALIQTLEYENTETTPAPDSRFVDIVVDDGATDSTGLSEEATITIDVEGDNVAPALVEISDVTVLAGSPLFIPLNGLDQDGDNLTFTAETSADSSLLNVDVPVGNRSIRFGVDGFGDMVFELFENLAPRATDRIIELAEDGFHEDIIFHRVINNFVIQGGDPTGTGTGGSTLGDFDDQFHVDLQHNRTGLLSQAKSTDDTNDSQFFVTEGPQRSLDFNHTIFGLLTEGESVRDAISNVPTALGDRPLDPPTIGSVEVFADTSNGVLMLSAPEGQVGNTTVAVTVSDGNGGTSQQTFNVEVVPDSINSEPFLDDILDQQVAIREEITVQLTAQDVEGDSFVFLDQEAIEDINAPLIPTNQLFIPVRQAAPVTYSVDPNTGVLTFSSVSPGEFEVTVAVVSSLDGLNARSPIDYQVVRFTVA